MINKDNIYVAECPYCKNLNITHVMWGSCAYRCECRPDEVMHMDYISDDEIKKNQQKYKNVIDTYIKIKNNELKLL